MSNRRVLKTVVGSAAAVAALVAPSLLTTQPVTQPEAQGCYNGVVVGNPWADSCNFGPRPPRVRGGAPDQTAIIACRGIPGCLAWYVNGPW
ncbi:Uncharacterised protein [Mycolicibacterium phlei]|jgi:hypothetical protein|uniref:hypothetical protein n=1 Tax=Mycolicibacterium phlei TaxID=1771 RepID=UPI0005910077|nr:hypothetical protein [Mycolicibacterium phlei]AMO63556.1 hypothetical protein MPHLCCUG_04771 [Mycolicibacterium phlei]KXW78189.1 hypothetical protein JL15_07265 [Mycolicibacterium phlei DSM 43071]STZ22013.1 Uncharacterised protein [Mycolicibacterium phlei]VEG11650.1 Uncharacterised protein [Mycobacteroides chelonae]